MAKINFFQFKERRLLKEIRTNPQNREGYLKLGKLYFLNRDYARAVDAYQQGLKIDPGNIPLLLNLGVTKEAQNKIEQAKDLYLKILEIDANHQTAQERLNKITSF